MITRDQLISAGIRNLKEFGYPSVDAESILSDQIYKEFFRSMLEDNLGRGSDEPIKALLTEIGDD